MVAAQRFDDGRADEAMQLVVIRNRQSHALERLDDAGDDAGIGLRERAVQIQQDDLLRMIGHCFSSRAAPAHTVDIRDV